MSKIYKISVLTLMILVLGGVPDIHAQNNRTLSGIVLDKSGEAVVGAVVMAEGASGTGVAADADGKFSITLPGSVARVAVQSLGYKPASFAVPSDGYLKVVLEEDSEMLDRVVVVGYGSMRESDITGSVTNVKIDEQGAARSSSLDQMLKGRAAGVSVLSTSAAPGAGVSIKIRGNSSFNGGGEPLYVVDGVILNSPTGDNETLMSKSSGNYEEETNGLLGINPQDIASMEILKDASATAIYGAMGANGVVLITTKGAEKEKPVIRFNAGTDISRAYRQIDMLDLDSFMDYVHLQEYTAYDSRVYNDPTDPASGYKVTPVNWQDYSMRTAVNQRYYLSVANKSKSTQYFFSVGYNKSNGIIKLTDLDQFNFRLNLDQQIRKDLSVALKVNMSKVTSNMMQGASSEGMASNTSFIRCMMNGRPYISEVYDEDDDALDLEEDYGSGVDRWLIDSRNVRDEYRVIPNLALTWKINRYLTFKSSAGADLRIKKQTKWKGPYVSRDTKWALSAIGTSERFNSNFDELLLFNRKFSDHSFSGTLGATLINSDTYSEITDGWNINQYYAQFHNINSAPITSTRLSYTESSSSTLSFLSRLVYSYKDRYVLTATFRRDGSSRFSKENRFANFPSVAFAWRANEEPWFNIDRISTLKLRLGWGRVGNQAIASYQTLSNYKSAYWPDHLEGNAKEVIVGLVPQNLANPDLRWETTEQVNAGVDLRLNRNRLKFTLDFYDKNTIDLLQKVNIPGITGFTHMWANMGSINNRGVEFSMESVLVKNHRLEWTVFGNVSHNRNTITDIGIPADGGAVPYFYGTPVGSTNYCTAPVNIFIQGRPMGLFYGFKTDGIVQEGETGPGLLEGTVMGPGSIKYVDLNGNGYVDEGDRTVIGDPNPELTYGFGTNLTWKRMSLDVTFEGVWGKDIANLNLIQETDISRRSMNIRREVMTDRWTPENPGGMYPAIGCYNAAETKFFMDRFVEDASYLRLADVTLTYDLPIKPGFVKAASLSVSGSNLLLFTGYSGWDPDVNSYGSDMMRTGVDFGSYPSARKLSFDVKLTF